MSAGKGVSTPSSTTARLLKEKGTKENGRSSISPANPSGEGEGGDNVSDFLASRAKFIAERLREERRGLVVSGDRLCRSGKGTEVNKSRAAEAKILQGQEVGARSAPRGGGGEQEPFSRPLTEKQHQKKEGRRGGIGRICSGRYARSSPSQDGGTKKGKLLSALGGRGDAPRQHPNRGGKRGHIEFDSVTFISRENFLPYRAGHIRGSLRKKRRGLYRPQAVLWNIEGSEAHLLHPYRRREEKVTGGEGTGRAAVRAHEFIQRIEESATNLSGVPSASGKIHRSQRGEKRTAMRWPLQPDGGRRRRENTLRAAV